MSATLNGKPLVDRSNMGKPRNYQDQILWSRELNKEIKQGFPKLITRIWELFDTDASNISKISS